MAPQHTLFDGMPWAQYSKFQETFGFDPHPELRGLLEATNGIKGEHGFDLIWPIERTIEENCRIRCDHRLRKQYMPLDCHMFFSDAGNGDLFGYAVVDNEIRCSDVFMWSHEDDSRCVVATNLKSFIESWIDGSLEL